MVTRAFGGSAAELVLRALSGHDTTDDELRSLFSQYGEVLSVHLVTDRETGRLRGFGFVEAGQSDLFFHHSDVEGVSFDELWDRPISEIAQQVCAPA